MNKGKWFGKVSFIIGQLIGFVALIAVIYETIKTGLVNWSVVSNLLVYQGSLIAVTWGSVATKNFRRGPVTSPEE